MLDRAPPMRRRSLMRLALCLLGLLVATPTAAAAQRPLSPIERRLIFEAVQAGPEPTEALLAALPDEVLLATIVRQGRQETGQRLDPRQLNSLWGLTPERRDIAHEAEQALAGGRLEAWLKTLAPDDRDYRALLAARCRYLDLLAGGGWPRLPEGPTLTPGEAHPHWTLVAERLKIEGYDTKPGGPAGADPTTLAALRSFQARHGLVVDGLVGPQTRAELNVPVEARIMQIEANLERRRWLPRQAPATRLEVDVAGAVATLHVDGQPRLTMRVIVGDRQHKTPLFVSQVDAVVINPPWNVPSSIAAAEIMPRARRDPAYLARNGFRVVDGRLQQQPGPGNALGRLKFDLQSPYGVYLHDTPGRAAFARPIRTLSHGCMRLEKPAELAGQLLAAQGWTVAGLERAIDAGATRRVALQSPLPLIITYRTILVVDGELQFRPDPYGWDAELIAALAGSRTAALPASATECASPAA